MIFPAQPRTALTTLVPVRASNARRSLVTAVRQRAYYLVQYATDLRHGMVTRDVVRGPTTPHERGDVRPHEPSPARLLAGVLRALPLDPTGYTFVDLGAGKGAALIIAAKRGYGRLVGVEFDADLLAVARHNVRSLRRRRPTLADRIHLVHQDAAEYAWPPEPTVVYLFNPFGESTLRAVLARLEASLGAAPRPVFVVYVNPVQRHVLDASPLLAPLRTGPGFRVYRAQPARD
jgi:predicted RNA methylase